MRVIYTSAGPHCVCEVCGTKGPAAISVRKIPGLPDLVHTGHPDDWGLVVFKPPVIEAPRPPGHRPRIHPGMHAQEIANETGREVQAFACKVCRKKAEPQPDVH